MKFRSSLLKAMLLGTMTVPMLLISSYAQQEIDPSWHDPWAVTTPAAAQTTQASSAHQAKPQPTSFRASARLKKQVTKPEPRATQASATTPATASTQPITSTEPQKLAME